MLAGSGRPRTACDNCKRQKVSISGGDINDLLNSWQVRCSGERPACRRCARFRHDCGYANETPILLASIKPVAGEPQNLDRCSYFSPTSLIRRPTEDASLGIPKPLLAALVDVYYSHIYNASLLLHRKTFQQALAAGTADPAVVLSVCAFASMYDHDPIDHSSPPVD